MLVIKRLPRKAFIWVKTHAYRTHPRNSKFQGKIFKSRLPRNWIKIFISADSAWFTESFPIFLIVKNYLTKKLSRSLWPEFNLVMLPINWWTKNIFNKLEKGGEKDFRPTFYQTLDFVNVLYERTLTEGSERNWLPHVPFMFDIDIVTGTVFTQYHMARGQSGRSEGVKLDDQKARYWTVMFETERSKKANNRWYLDIFGSKDRSLSRDCPL